MLQARAPQESELVLRDDVRGDGERFMQAHGTVLRDESGHAIGALVVLNDVTRLRRLETVRREFVANVSHELKTPITSIKGFVETLLEGAYRNPEEALNFLGIVAKQADRLNAIIEDLLMLSRLEQEEREERKGKPGRCGQWHTPTHSPGCPTGRPYQSFCCPGASRLIGRAARHRSCRRSCPARPS